jgi:hypothetical protein
MRIDDLDIYDDWHGLRAISPAKVLRLVERKDAEIDQLHRELIKIGLNRHEHFAPRLTQETIAECPFCPSDGRPCPADTNEDL